MPWTTFDSSGKQQIAGSVADMPVGTVQPYAGANAPNGWLMCDGSSLSKTAFPELFAAIGYTYGGSGSSFSLPDLRGRVVAGKDNMGGTAASRLTNSGTGNPNIDGSSLGAAGGVDRHTLTTAQMPSHTHVQDSHGHSNTGQTFNGAVGAGYVMGSSGNMGLGSVNQWGVANTTATNQNTGGDAAHPNTQPTIVLNYIIFATSLDKRIKVLTPPQYVSALPAAPIDGQVVFYQADATNGVVWQLRYNAASSSSYKWEFVGGSDLTSKVDTQQGNTGGGWQNLTTDGPSVTMPLAGDYIVSFGCGISSGTNTSNNLTAVGIVVGNNTPADGPDAAYVGGIYYLNSLTGYAQPFRSSTKTGQSANTTWKMRYYSNSSTNGVAAWSERRISLTPVRVG